jgi:hypothetical protein
MPVRTGEGAKFGIAQEFSHLADRPLCLDAVQIAHIAPYFFYQFPERAPFLHQFAPQSPFG